MSVQSLTDKLNRMVADKTITRAVAEELAKELDMASSINGLEFLRSAFIHPFPPTSTLPIIRSNPSGAVITVNGASHIIDTSTVPLANRIVELGENRGPLSVSTEEMPFGILGYTTCFMSGIMDSDLTLGIATSQTVVGFGFGTRDSNAPFPANPTHPCARYQHNILSGKAQLFSAVGDGITPPTIIDLGNIIYGIPIFLVSIPGESLAVYNSSDKMGEITNPSLLPQWSSAYKVRSTIFQATGTGVGAAIHSSYSYLNFGFI
jgi:hypothetical protein